MTSKLHNFSRWRTIYLCLAMLLSLVGLIYEDDICSQTSCDVFRTSHDYPLC